MDRKKVDLVFYISDERETTFSKLQQFGASGTVSSLLWVAKELASQGFRVSIVNSESCSQAFQDLNVQFLGARSNNFHLRDFLAPDCHPIIIIVGTPTLTQFRDQANSLQARFWLWHHNPISLAAIKGIHKLPIERHIFVSANHAIRYLILNPNEIVAFTRGRFSIIYNAIDTALLHRDPIAPFRPRESNSIVKVAYVGSTTPAKGFPEFLEFAARMLGYPEGTCLEWHVYGSGLYHKEFSDINQSNSVISHGTVGRAQLYDELSSVDFVACGLGGNETFCVAALEAALLGKTIITSNRGGQLEILAAYPYKTWINSISNPKHLITMISSEKNPDVLTKFRVLCRNLFSPEAVCNEWIKVIDGNIRFPVFAANISGLIRSLIGQR